MSTSRDCACKTALIPTNACPNYVITDDCVMHSVQSCGDPHGVHCWKNPAHHPCAVSTLLRIERECERLLTSPFMFDGDHDAVVEGNLARQISYMLDGAP